MLLQSKYCNKLVGFKMKTLFIYAFLFASVISFTIYPQKQKSESLSSKTYLFDVNRIKMPLNNYGVIADVNINGISGGKYDGVGFFFSGGFFLSGISNGTVWTNAVASASRISDYWPGPVASDSADPKNLIYVIKASDSAFGSSWNEWKDAVNQGAEFYDGNNDGIYMPIDLNSNGQWDPNEDRPQLIGDAIAFSVFNDGKPQAYRRFAVSPKGIEIHQTVFGFADSIHGTLNNTLFVKYKIINKGTTSNLMDSVYFSFWADPDIGNYTDDLVGSDTTLNSGYGYHNAPDSGYFPNYGVEAPAVLTTVLQGPMSYIPGVTFLDNNGNNVYDAGIDTPLDTGYVRKGKLLGTTVYPGAKNLGMTSFVHYMSSHPTQGDPNTHFETRNYLKGLDRVGSYLNPCIWPFGVVQGGVNCAGINPVFFYSGEPVVNIGWINNFKTDQRTMVNTGPFKLKVNEPIEVIGAIMVGRKYDHFYSLLEGKRIARFAANFYKSNFGEFPVGIKNDGEASKINFELSQNYPNPFNPSTVINYYLAVSGFVTLKIYDILGREVITLVNEEKPAGSYMVEFTAPKWLSSGMYFYELKANNFTQVKKLVLMK